MKNAKIKNNIDRFPEDFMFQLTSNEVKEHKLSQIVTASTNAFRKKPIGRMLLPSRAYTCL